MPSSNRRLLRCDTPMRLARRSTGDGRLPTTVQDGEVRLFVYRFWLERGTPPSAAEIAGAFSLTDGEAREALQRLHARHALLLDADGGSRIANPLSAVPTPSRVQAGGRWLSANCAWDSLGIPAMLHADARIKATYAHSGEPVAYEIRGGRLLAEPALVHYPLPFRRWYDDLIHT